MVTSFIIIPDAYLSNLQKIKRLELYRDDIPFLEEMKYRSLVAITLYIAVFHTVSLLYAVLLLNEEIITSFKRKVMRKIILSMQVSLDGYVEGPPGNEMDWFPTEEHDSWIDMFETLKPVDTMITGRKMSEGYYEYWNKALTDPNAPKDHADFARLADKTQHLIFSKTWDTVKWKNAKVVNGTPEEEVAKLKQQPGKDIIIWGGASLAASFINKNLVDKFRLAIVPVILGGGKRLFDNVTNLAPLKLVETKTLKSGVVILKYDRD